MKILLMFLAASAASVLTVKADHKRDAPWIVSARQGENKCTENDPLGPCYSRLLLIENPLKDPVILKLDCGLDLSEPEVTIPARVRQEVEITSDAPGGTPGCSIRSWSRKK